MYEYRTLKPVEDILRRGVGEEENSRRDKPNFGTICVYKEMLQQNSLYSYHMPTKTFLNI
jgi:hypothetical protein